MRYGIVAEAHDQNDLRVGKLPGDGHYGLRRLRGFRFHCEFALLRLASLWSPSGEELPPRERAIRIAKTKDAIGMKNFDQNPTSE